MEADQINTDVSSNPSCSGCVAAAAELMAAGKRISDLETRIKLLEQKLESALRAGKRQAAPFSRSLPKLNPKKPGRKSGDDYGAKAFRAIPSTIDEVHEAPLPDRCPKCGGRQFLDERWWIGKYGAGIARRLGP